MEGNISLLICSFVFIGILLYYLYKIWPDLDVLDLYILFILFHFGLYPFLRGLYFGKDLIFDFRDSNPLIIGLVFVHLLLILIVIKIIYRYFPKSFVECLRIKNLIQQWSCINKYILLFIYGTLIGFQIHSYYTYGIKTYIHPDDFARIGKDLPYWFTAIRTIYPLLAFLVGLGLISIFLKSQGYHKVVWLILTIGFLPVITLHGRRFLLAMIIVFTVLWLMEKRKDIFSVKYVTFGLLIVLLFFLFSNIYEAYRYNLQSVGPFSARLGRSTVKVINPYTEAINFDATLQNFKRRPGTWEFNFLVFNHQSSKPNMVTNGKITWEAVKSSIPRVFWPNKQFKCIDEILADLYRVKIKEIDIGKNIFGVGQVDFGYYSLIIVPLTILIIIVIMGALVKMTMQYPVFLWLFSGNILLFLINTEENGNEMFFMLRNIGLILIIFCGYLLANKILKFALTKRRKVFASIED